ncbi:MAG: hypothetical protein ACLU9S_02910 [Oscillospiraceae bacterium]
MPIEFRRCREGLLDSLLRKEDASGDHFKIWPVRNSLRRVVDYAANPTRPSTAARPRRCTTRRTTRRPLYRKRPSW